MSDDAGTPGPAGRHTPRVLVADDNATNRRVAELALLRHPVEVVTVADGAGALERLATEPFDLVLLDGMMPGMDGSAVAREIRRRERAAGIPPIPVVALTASSDDGDRQRMLDAGMDDHLVKPLRPEDLEALLGRWLGAAPRTIAIPGPAAGGPTASPAGRGDAPPPPVPGAPSAPSAPAGPAGPPSPVLDERIFGRLLDLGDARFVERMVGLFLADAAERVAQVDDALETGDEAALRQALHALEGICATIGAVALDRRVRELHDEVRRGHRDGAPGTPPGASGLGPMLDATRARLRQELRGATEG